MDNLDHLSDDELRVRLLQYGFENLPITQTTRKTLIKKLRNHLANTNTNLRKTTSLAKRYSSGEDSDGNDGSNSKARKPRMTVSGSPGDQRMPPPSFSMPQSRMPVNKTPSPVSSPYTRSGMNTSASKKSSVYVSPVIINDSQDDDIDWSIRKNRLLNSSKNSSSRSRTDFYTTLDASNSRSFNGSNGHEQDESDDTNTTSEYTKRLLQFREGNIQRQNAAARKRTTYTSQRLSDYQPVNENDIVFHAEPSLEPAHIPLNMAIKNFINRLDSAYGFKQTFVPMVLVTFLIIFFLLIIFAYVSISPKIEDILNPATTLYVPCGEHQEADASYTCIHEHSLEASLNLLKILAPELQARALAQRCGDKQTTTSSIMCFKDSWQFLSDNQQQSRINAHGMDIIKNIHNIEYLVDRNKQWGIQNINADGEAITLDDVLDLRAHQAECLAVLKPKLPITCSIYNKIQTFFLIIGTLAILTVGVFAVQKFYQFVLHVKDKRRQQVDHIIREICTALMEKSMQDKENSSVVLNHLRDKIIEPSKRSELAWAWQEAIGYLEQNDSRIHFGVETINGEDFKVIRWIDEVKNLLNSGGGLSAQQQQQQSQQQRFSTSRYPPQVEDRTYKKKVWRCPAFDKSNKIKDPPTNCLKIRQMFDKYEANNPNLPTLIADTILHKLRDKNCKIYDIQLDLKTCCVYVKCASCVEAGIVHEQINGWWLDAALVYVKFLKQEKYHQRFPSSINACTVLYPSSNVYVTQSESEANGHDDYYDEEIDDDDYE